MPRIILFISVLIENCELIDFKTATFEGKKPHIRTVSKIWTSELDFQPANLPTFYHF